MTINDAKLAKLETITSSVGSVDDLEVQWLLSVLGAYTGPVNVNDLWHAYWDSLAVAAGSFNDRAYDWLGGLLYTGSLDDRWLAYWSA